MSPLLVRLRALLISVSFYAQSLEAHARPNIVFLVCESTDGRTWTPGYSGGVLDSALARGIGRLQQSGGHNFVTHYSNTPVCCPSRATFWSGRHAHNIPHEHNGLLVGGVWNNYEGLPSNFTNRMDQILTRTTGMGTGRSPYNVRMSGKFDWSSGSHSLNVRLNSWTMYMRFPYNISHTGGWVDETGECSSNGTVLPAGKGSAHADDWKVVNESVKWIAENAGHGKSPFFVYQGMNIVHPPYRTSHEYYLKVDPDKVTVPPWQPLSSLHPCDLQSSMLKGCTPSNADSKAFYSVARRRNVRRIYLAMIAEFSDMVASYVEAVDAAGVLDNTVFIVTSDHGDMQLEHQQHYKMVPYDASARVPMVIFDGRFDGKRRDRGSAAGPKTVSAPTQLIDIFPTVMDLAEIPESGRPAGLDGQSLVPLLEDGRARRPRGGAGAAAAGKGEESRARELGATTGDSERQRPPFVVSQFHGCNIAMSWFLIVQDFGGAVGTFKLIHYGTGKEVPSMLYNLTADSSENRNLLQQHAESSVGDIADTMDRNLRSVVDYPAVATAVAQYGKDSLRLWVNATGPSWRDRIHAKDLRWTSSWNADPAASMQALEDWFEQPAQVMPCRAELVWPPQ